jgi:hypothetical protein
VGHGRSHLSCSCLIIVVWYKSCWFKPFIAKSHYVQQTPLHKHPRETLDLGHTLTCAANIFISWPSIWPRTYSAIALVVLAYRSALTLAPILYICNCNSLSHGTSSLMPFDFILLLCFSPFLHHNKQYRHFFLLHFYPFLHSDQQTNVLTGFHSFTQSSHFVQPQTILEMWCTLPRSTSWVSLSIGLTHDGSSLAFI